MWYAEHKSLGRWWVQTFRDMPSLKGMDGQRRNLRQICEIDAGDEKMNFAELKAKYGTKEEALGPADIWPVMGY